MGGLAVWLVGWKTALYRLRLEMRREKKRKEKEQESERKKCISLESNQSNHVLLFSPILFLRSLSGRAVLCRTSVVSLGEDGFYFSISSSIKNMRKRKGEKENAVRNEENID